MRRIITVIISCIFVATLTGPYCFAQTANSMKGEPKKKISRQNTKTNAGGEYEKGKTLYKSKCQFCHGILGDGKGPAAEPLLRHPVDFTDTEFWKENVNKKIDETIKNGKEMMPAFNLEPEQIKFITLYISQTFKK
jgi:mono/diheme cytochrome c family protein